MDRYRNNPRFDKQIDRIRGSGFIAALDQSGGSTPKALKNYGIDESAYASEDDMFRLIHDMRSRIVTSSSFDGTRIMAAILFERTMEQDIAGLSSPDYLWETKGIVPILKVDEGLESEQDGVQLMKPISGLVNRLQRAQERHIFGTKMRSVIKHANPEGIQAVVHQQFEIAQQILAHDLIPIIEPEVDIHSQEKSDCESMLLSAVTDALGHLNSDLPIMFKLTLPEEANLYSPLANHPKVLRVVALSGGYDIDTANEKLSRNTGMVASFSRALTERLKHEQTQEEFDLALDSAIGEIYEASINPN